MYDVVVIGGGLAGLATALPLVASGLNVVVLEASGRFGGKIQTDYVEGCVCETGPNGFLTRDTAMADLCKSLGLGAQLIEADQAAQRRYLLVDGQLTPLGPKLLASGILPAASWLRVAADLWTPSANTDESVTDFFARRFGQAIADSFAEAAVIGISGGDPTMTSVQSILPSLHRVEQRYESVIRGVASAAKQRADSAPTQHSGRLHSLSGGLGRLVHAAAARLGDAGQCGSEVQAITRDRIGWRVDVDGPAGAQRALLARDVVIATPPPVTARLLRAVSGQAARAVAGISTAGMRVVAMGFPEGALRTDGFGFLAPGRTGSSMLGCVFTSRVFPTHAAPGFEVLRCMVGGSRAPSLLECPKPELVNALTRELHALVGVGTEIVPPLFVRDTIWPAAIPQLHVGHRDRTNAIHCALQGQGIHIAGSGIHGIGLNDVAGDGARVARAILDPITDT